MNSEEIVRLRHLMKQGAQVIYIDVNNINYAKPVFVERIGQNGFAFLADGCGGAVNCEEHPSREFAILNRDWAAAL